MNELIHVKLKRFYVNEHLHLRKRRVHVKLSPQIGDPGNKFFHVKWRKPASNAA